VPERKIITRSTVEKLKSVDVDVQKMMQSSRDVA